MYNKLICQPILNDASQQIKMSINKFSKFLQDPYESTSTITCCASISFPLFRALTLN